ncbi:hypothetical protein AHAS_AhasUnG0018700 [Arachis hypogaea]
MIPSVLSCGRANVLSIIHGSSCLSSVRNLESNLLPITIPSVLSGGRENVSGEFIAQRPWFFMPFCGKRQTTNEQIWIF